MALAQRWRPCSETARPARAPCRIGKIHRDWFLELFARPSAEEAEDFVKGVSSAPRFCFGDRSMPCYLYPTCGGLYDTEFQ
jgi:hypothetical protein